MRVAWRERLRSWPARVVAAAVVSLALASCTQTAPPVGQGAASRSGGVISLNEISTLKSVFNRDDGHLRLVLIFSPT
jgi:hypothetical protein